MAGEAMAEDRAADHTVGVDGKVVLVTGASRGIGACCVRSLLDGGASVVVHYNTRREAAEALAQAAPERCFPVGADLSEEEAPHDALAAGARLAGPDRRAHQQRGRLRGRACDHR